MAALSPLDMGRRPDSPLPAEFSQGGPDENWPRVHDSSDQHCDQRRDEEEIRSLCPRISMAAAITVVST